MELEGLIRSMAKLESNFKVGVVVTDRHVQVRKWLREQRKDVKHYFDTWHVAKGYYRC